MNDVLDFRVLTDGCTYSGELWSGVSDHRPVCVDVAWGHGARAIQAVAARLDHALSHLKCLAYFDEWRDDVYSQEWCIRWDSQRSDIYESKLNEWKSNMDMQRMLHVYDPLCGMDKSAWNQAQVDRLVPMLHEWVWEVAYKSEMISRSYMPLSVDKWGTSHVTIPVHIHSELDDLLWYDQGHMPRRFWWDESCDAAKQRVKEAECVYRT